MRQGKFAAQEQSLCHCATPPTVVVVVVAAAAAAAEAVL